MDILEVINTSIKPTIKLSMSDIVPESKVHENNLVQALNYEQEKLFELEQYNFEKNIITDDVVGVAFCAPKKYRKTSKNTAVLAQNLFIAEQIRDILIDLKNT